MADWRSHPYRQAGQAAGIDDAIIQHAVQTAEFLRQRSASLPPVFSLKHLANQTGVSYGFLRACVEREGPEPYRTFRIRKRQLTEGAKLRYRIICVPDPRLMAVQRWINQSILQKLPTHAASVAFGKEDSILKATTPHCPAKWLIKIDIVNFFESVSEQAAYHVFSNAGYQSLVAFELGRLSTRLGKHSYARRARRWQNWSNFDNAIRSYSHHRLGHLPQGAPTSPVLANLAMCQFDDDISTLALDNNFVYTRYADDITFSTSNDFNRGEAERIIGQVYRIIRRFGFQPNLAKTKIVPPGARRVVLGVLVDTDQPKLTKQYRDRLDQHLHFMLREDIGPVAHAAYLNFRSVYGLRNHVRGLIAHAVQIDEEYADTAWNRFNNIQWP